MLGTQSLFITVSVILAILEVTQVRVAVAQEATVLEQVIQYADQHPDGRAAYSFDRSAYQQELNDLPIGVFDSGIGGLTVLEAILALDAFNNDTLRPGADGRRDFENERFIYFGDQANMPYGNYAAKGKENFLKELVLKDAVFLLGRRYWPAASAPEPQWSKPPVKAIVIACNTATAYGLEEVRAACKQWDIPVFVLGVVESGARGVNELIPSDSPPKTVAVMATVGTCASRAYPTAIGSACGIAGKRVPQVIQQGSPALAGVIEGDRSFLKENQSQSEAIAACILDDVTALVDSYQVSGGQAPIDMVVLGCTHFPLVQEDIVAAFTKLRNQSAPDAGAGPYRQLIAERVQIVDPAALVAKELFRQLATHRVRAKVDQRAARNRDAYFISVPAPDLSRGSRSATGDLTSEYKYGRDPGHWDREDTRIVPMVAERLPDASRSLIQTRLPNVWARLSESAAQPLKRAN